MLQPLLLHPATRMMRQMQRKAQRRGGMPLPPARRAQVFGRVRKPLPTSSTPAWTSGTSRSPPATSIRASPCATTGPAPTSTATRTTSWPPTCPQQLDQPASPRLKPGETLCIADERLSAGEIGEPYRDVGTRRQAASNSSRRLVIGQAPSELLEITVCVTFDFGSCTLRNETPASHPSRITVSLCLPSQKPRP